MEPVTYPGLASAMLCCLGPVALIIVVGFAIAAIRFLLPWGDD